MGGEGARLFTRYIVAAIIPISISAENTMMMMTGVVMTSLLALGLNWKLMSQVEGPRLSSNAQKSRGSLSTVVSAESERLCVRLYWN